MIDGEEHKFLTKTALGEDRAIVLFRQDGEDYLEITSPTEGMKEIVKIPVRMRYWLKENQL